MNANELPTPVTATDLYLAAILDELRRLNAASSSLVPEKVKEVPKRK